VLIFFFISQIVQVPELIGKKENLQLPVGFAASADKFASLVFDRSI
jgi:hypothetical protein